MSYLDASFEIHKLNETFHESRNVFLSQENIVYSVLSREKNVTRCELEPFIFVPGSRCCAAAGCEARAARCVRILGLGDVRLVGSFEG